MAHSNPTFGSRGIIALDIDGTTTAQAHSVPRTVIDYLHDLSSDGWNILFVTGRTFQWAYPTLDQLNFPFHLAVQNGAIVVSLPERRVVSRSLVDCSVFPTMEEICRSEPTDFALFTGFENQDRIYYRPERFTPWLREYLEERCVAFREEWLPVDDYTPPPVQQVASLKCFGYRDSLERICRKIEEQLDLHVPLIRDPFAKDFFVAQATHKNADKGSALLTVKQLLCPTGQAIVAGDDLNDLSMLAHADVKVVMATAPQALLEIADVIAPSAELEGIIQGLKQATERVIL